jgi:hypothetical protein
VVIICERVEPGSGEREKLVALGNSLGKIRPF